MTVVARLTPAVTGKIGSILSNNDNYGMGGRTPRTKTSVDSRHRALMRSRSVRDLRETAADSLRPALKRSQSAPDLTQSDWMTMRDEIDEVSSGCGSCYSVMVRGVNSILNDWNVGIEPDTARAILKNMEAIEQVRCSETVASLHESVNFFGDMVKNIRSGNFKDAVADACGVIMNALGSTLFFSNYDAAKLPRDFQHSYFQSHP